MAKPVNKSYFPLRRQLPEHKKLSRKQLAAVKRALAKRGRKLPKAGFCIGLTKIGGKHRPELVISSVHSTVEICHEVYNGKHEYTMRSHPRRTRY